MTTLRERIRSAELERVRRHVPPLAKVLEIGGARGFQAKILAEWGMDVISVDTAPESTEDACYPVQHYDGRRILFPDRSFDVVFSSNVLEHVDDVRALLEEAARVLKPDGIMVHVLPSATWRWWTSMVHYVWIILAVIVRVKNPETPTPKPHRPYTVRNLLRFAWEIAFPHAHGVYANAFVELYCYSRRRWKKFFKSSGLTVIEVEPAGIFYTAYKLMPWIDVPRRKRLATLLGSSCNLYVLRVPNTHETM